MQHGVKIAEFLLHFGFEDSHALLEEVEGFVIFFDEEVGLPDSLHEVTGVVLQLTDDLKSFVIFQYFIGEVPHEVLLGRIPVQLVDDPDLFVDVSDILRPLELRYIDLDVTINYKFASVVQFEQLLVQSVQQRSQNEDRNNCGDDDEDDGGDEQSIEGVGVYVGEFELDSENFEVVVHQDVEGWTVSFCLRVREVDGQNVVDLISITVEIEILTVLHGGERF